MIKLILLSVILIGIAFALIAVRSLFIKGAEFRGTCSGANPALREKGIECSICGAKPDEACKGDETEKYVNE